MAGPVTTPPVGSTAVRCGRRPKNAHTVRLPLILRVQVRPAPLHAPPQPRKPKPAAGRAVRVTRWSRLKVALQVGGQLIRGPVTVPPTGVWTVSRGDRDCAAEYAPGAPTR